MQQHYKVTAKHILGSCDLLLTEKQEEDYLTLKIDGTFRVGFKKSVVNGFATYFVSKENHRQIESQLKAPGFGLDEKYNLKDKTKNLNFVSWNSYFEKNELEEPKELIIALLFLIKNDKLVKHTQTPLLINLKNKVHSIIIKKTENECEVFQKEKKLFSLSYLKKTFLLKIKKIEIRFQIEQKNILLT